MLAKFKVSLEFTPAVVENKTYTNFFQLSSVSELRYLGMYISSRFKAEEEVIYLDE